MPKRPSMQDRKPETPRASASSDTTLMGRERARREVVELLIREVMPNRQQPRTAFDEASLSELAESIRIHGVLEPIIVREIPLTPYEGRGCQYELIAGERRWRAAARAEIATIPALVLPEATSDRAALELAITENLQREDLHPLDEAIAFGRMQSDLGYSYAQIAERLGKSKGYVQNRMRLLQLDEDLQQLVAERPDTLSHVSELAKLKDPEQRRALIAAVRAEQLSFPETRARVQAILSPPPPEPGAPYLRRYDSDEIHEPSDAPALGSVPYLRRYDGDENHNASHVDDSEGASGQPAPVRRRQGSIDKATFLSAAERAAFSAVSLRIEGGAGVPAGADLALLRRLATLVSALAPDDREAGDRESPPHR